MSRLGKKIPIRACVFTFSLKLEKWSFHVADFVDDNNNNNNNNNNNDDHNNNNNNNNNLLLIRRKYLYEYTVFRCALQVPLK